MEGYSTYGNGLLYNWYAVSGLDANGVTHRFAPIGWHVPTQTEFSTLATYLGGASVAGGKMKSTRTATPYFSSNVGATNESGFSALGGGIRLTNGSYSSINVYGFMWSSTDQGTEGYHIELINSSATLRSDYQVSGLKKYGFSVRLIKDDSNWYPGMTVTDLDGNKYPTIKIGEQVWLQSNWKCTKYADGVPIAFNLSAHVDKFSASEWQNLTYGGYCSYNDVAIVEYTTPNQYKYPTKHFILPKITDLSAQKNNGLVAAYNCQPVNGVLTDISGNGNRMTMSNVIQNQLGLQFNGINSRGTCTGSNGLTDDISISARIYLNGYGEGNNGRIFDSGNIRFAVSSSNSGVLYFYRGSTQIYSAAGSLPLNRFISVTVTSTAAGVTNFYINGVLSGTANQATGSSVSSTTWYIGSNSSTRWFNGIIQDLRIYTKILSTKEIKDYHNSFVKPTLIEDFKNNPINTNLTPYGWNKGTGVYKVEEFIIQTGERIISETDKLSSGSIGNWYKVTSDNSSIVEWDNVKSALKMSYNGTTNYVYARLADARIKPVTNSTVMRVRAKVYIESLNTNLFSFILRGSSTLENSYSIKSLPQNTWNSVDFMLQILPPSTTTYLDFRLNSLSGNNVVYLKDVSLTEVSPLLGLIHKSKYLECVTAGTLAIPSSQAYGTWEFSWYKGSTNNEIQVYYVSSAMTRINGYSCSFTLNEYVYFGKQTNSNTAGLFYYTSEGLSNNTWYRMKITRSTAGVFTFYIKGGALVPTTGYNGWTLYSTATFGSNPATDTSHTSSNYFLIDIDSGDRITDIRLYDGIIV